MTIIERVRILIESEYSQSVFADKTNLTKATVSRIMNKEGQIRSDTLEAIALALPNLNTRWLLTGQGPIWLDQEEVSKTTTSSPGQSDARVERFIKLLEQRVQILEQIILENDPNLAKKVGLL